MFLNDLQALSLVGTLHLFLLLHLVLHRLALPFQSLILPLQLFHIRHQVFQDQLQGVSHLKVLLALFLQTGLRLDEAPTEPDIELLFLQREDVALQVGILLLDGLYLLLDVLLDLFFHLNVVVSV